MKDLKEGLSSARKADITHVRSSLMVYIARACEYGSAKYERANYARPVGEDTRADFERLRSYLRAGVSHLIATLDEMERHQAMDPNLEDVDGMRRAAYAEDTDAKPGCSVGASSLPHLAHAAASIMMAIEQATLYDLLPADPGRPWEALDRYIPTHRCSECRCTWRIVELNGDESWQCLGTPGPCCDNTAMDNVEPIRGLDVARAHHAVEADGWSTLYGGKGYRQG